MLVGFSCVQAAADGGGGQEVVAGRRQGGCLGCRGMLPIILMDCSSPKLYASAVLVIWTAQLSEVFSELVSVVDLGCLLCTAVHC